MTREEKMWEAVEKEHGKLSRREAFVALTAMEWGDETMIDKACRRLIEMIDEDVLIKCGSVIKCVDAVEFSEYFRKAMLEEE